MEFLKTEKTVLTPKYLLEEYLYNMIGKRDAFKKGKKLFIVCLDDEDENDYHITWDQVGMSYEEILYLLDFCKESVIENSDINSS